MVLKPDNSACGVPQRQHVRRVSRATIQVVQRLARPPSAKDTSYLEAAVPLDRSHCHFFETEALGTLHGIVADQ